MTERTSDPNEVPALGAILVVDDEELVRRVVARQLIRAGYSVHEAGSGDEALQLLESLAAEDRDALRAALVDLSMPGLRGPALLTRFKEVFPELPLVVLSGHVESPEALGDAAAVLQKPILSGELLRVLESVAR